MCVKLVYDRGRLWHGVANNVVYVLDRTVNMTHHGGKEGVKVNPTASGVVKCKVRNATAPIPMEASGDHLPLSRSPIVVSSPESQRLGAGQVPAVAFASCLSAWHSPGSGYGSFCSASGIRFWPILHAAILVLGFVFCTSISYIIFLGFGLFPWHRLAASSAAAACLVLIWLLYVLAIAIAIAIAGLLRSARTSSLSRAALIIKMTKYLEKIINLVCMFGKIISCRYKVPFMSCLYLISPKSCHRKSRGESTPRRVAFASQELESSQLNPKVDVEVPQSRF